MDFNFISFIHELAAYISISGGKSSHIKQRKGTKKERGKGSKTLPGADGHDRFNDSMRVSGGNIKKRSLYRSPLLAARLRFFRSETITRKSLLG